MKKATHIESVTARAVALGLSMVLLGGCQMMQTDTGKGAAIGGGTGR